jgi:hypothetical protein
MKDRLMGSEYQEKATIGDKFKGTRKPIARPEKI